MKWIGQHIVDFIARFRSDVYLEGITTSTETDMLVIDSSNKVSKRAIDAITVDVSDFMTDGANNRILTATGTDAMLAETYATFVNTGNVSTLSMISNQDTGDLFSIATTTNGATTLTTADAVGAEANFEIAADGDITLDAQGDIILEAAGNDISMDADTLTIFSSTTLAPFVTLRSTGNNAYGGYLTFNKQQDDNEPADGDTVGSIQFVGEDQNGATEGYGSIVGSIVETDEGDEAGKIQILVANDGTEVNGITVSGDKGTAAEVDITLANGAASVTTIAGTLTMGSTAFANNSGVVQVATQGTIDHDSLANFVAAEHVDWAGSSAGTIHSSNIPTLNQSTTGGAATLTTPRAINGVNFDGSAPITVTAAGSTLSDTVTVAKGGTGLTTVAANTILTGDGTNALTSEANFAFSSAEDRLIIGANTEIAPHVRIYNDENTVNIGVTSTSNGLLAGSADGDFVINCSGDHNVLFGQNDAIAAKIDTDGDFNLNRKFTITADADASYEGDVVYFGGTTTIKGRIYHYKSDGTWELANPNAVTTSDGLLAVSLGTASDTNGMLLRGMVTLDHDPGAVGDVLYLDEQQVADGTDGTSRYGAATDGAPAGNNDIVRVIGYCLHASNGQMWFNPDSTFVEVTA